MRCSTASGRPRAAPSRLGSIRPTSTPPANSASAWPTSARPRVNPTPDSRDGGRRTPAAPADTRAPARDRGAMSETPTPTPPADGALARLVAGAAAGAARRPKRMIALWVLLVAACLVPGGMAGTKQLTDTQAGTGQSRTADERIDAAGLGEPATESILVRSASPSATAAAARDLQARLAR